MRSRRLQEIYPTRAPPAIGRIVTSEDAGVALIPPTQRTTRGDVRRDEVFTGIDVNARGAAWAGRGGTASDTGSRGRSRQSIPMTAETAQARDSRPVPSLH